jgi:hypothetical protein
MRQRLTGLSGYGLRRTDFAFRYHPKTVAEFALLVGELPGMPTFGSGADSPAKPSKSVISTFDASPGRQSFAQPRLLPWAVLKPRMLRRWSSRLVIQMVKNGHGLRIILCG